MIRLYAYLDSTIVRTGWGTYSFSISAAFCIAHCYSIRVKYVTLRITNDPTQFLENNLSLKYILHATLQKIHLYPTYILENNITSIQYFSVLPIK